jgi:hypothetical protein
VVDEEAWWLDVLHDPRARWPTEKCLSATGPHAHLRLDRFRGPVMTLACRRCGVRKSFDTAVLRQFGEDYKHHTAAARAGARVPFGSPGRLLSALDERSLARLR